MFQPGVGFQELAFLGCCGGVFLLVAVVLIAVVLGSARHGGRDYYGPRSEPHQLPDDDDD